MGLPAGTLVVGEGVGDGDVGGGSTVVVADAVAIGVGEFVGVDDGVGPGSVKSEAAAGGRNTSVRAASAEVGKTVSGWWCAAAAGGRERTPGSLSECGTAGSIGANAKLAAHVPLVMVCPNAPRNGRGERAVRRRRRCRAFRRGPVEVPGRHAQISSPLRSQMASTSSWGRSRTMPVQVVVATMSRSC
ncbi:hypothetical protein BJF79_15445 [Actinomadura sp. CNU-125]|nr:hypothetical protein BJF79_15445 [Actinomadura sp. CNU-125]